MINRGYTFGKHERLSSRKSISLLFEEGNSFFSYPFTVIWRPVEPLPRTNLQAGISVPKKLFKRAVDRNRIKRIIREAWRHNKNELCNYLEQHDINVVIMMVYAGREIPTLTGMNVRTARLIEKFLLLLDSSPLPVKGGEISGSRLKD